MKRSEDQVKGYQTFEDLEVYQVAREFRKAMYRVVKHSQPDPAPAVSLTNNIAEGHGRFHFLEQIKFILQARGSLEELLDDLNICQDERYLTVVEVEKLKQEAWRVHKLINGYIRFLRSCVEGSPRVQEFPSDNELSEDELSALFLSRFNSSSL